MRKSILFAVSLLVALSLLTACATPTPEIIKETVEVEKVVKETVEVEKIVEVTVAPEKVTVDWWHIWANEANIAEPFQALADKYMAEHPNVEIVITTMENEAFKAKIATVMQSGDPPDVFQSWGGGLMGTYADAGLLVDLTDYMAEGGWGDSIADGAEALYKWNGKNYAVPWRAGMVGMWYNKDLFAQAGIEAPPATWTELLEDVQLLKDAGITPIAIGEGEMWPGMFWYACLLMNTASPDEILAAQNRSGAFNSPGYVQAGELLEELVALEPFQEGFLAAGYGDAEALMANNQAAMQLMGHWAYGFASAALAEDVEAYDNYIGWFPFPKVEGAGGEPTAIFGGGDSFAVGINAPLEAVDFVRYLTSMEAHYMLVQSGAVPLPIVEGVAANYANPLFNDIAVNISASSFTLNYLDHQFPPPLNTAVNEEVQKIFAGMATGQEVADALEALAVEHLD